MANPIFHSDLVKDDGSIDVTIEKLKDLQKEYTNTLTAIKKDALKLKVSIEQANTASTQQREEVQKLAKDADKLSKAQKSYQDTLTQTGKELAQLREAKRKQNQINKLTIKLNENEEGSYNRLSAQYSLLKIRINAMGEATGKAAIEKRKLEKEAAALFGRMKDLQEATGKTALNVGNYKESVKDAIKETLGLGKAFDLLSKTPLLGVLTIIIAALGSLFNAFKKSEKGAILLEQATATINALFSNLIELSVKVVESVQNAFKDPLGSIKAFGQSLLDNVINRFVGFGELLFNVGKGIGQFLSGNLDKATDSFKKASTAGVKFVTGLDEQAQKDFANAVSEVTEEINKEVAAFQKLAAAQREVEKANRQLSIEAERLATQQETAQQRADDNTLSLKEQAKALEETLKLGEQRAQREQQIARNNLSLLTQEINLRRANGEQIRDLLNQQADAINAVEQADRELLLFQANAAQQRREIQRDAFERELDFAIDFFDAQKTLLERQVSDESRTLDQRFESAKRLADLNESAFAEQIKLVEDFTGQRIDLNQLALEDDERVVRERLRLLNLDDIVQGRILEILRERKALVQDLRDVNREVVEDSQKIFAPLDQLGGGGNLLEQETQKALSTFKDFKQEITKTVEEGENKGLFGLLGLTADDSERQAFTSALDFAKQQLFSFLQTRVDIANQAVEAANREVTAAEQNLQTQIQLAEQGLANNVATAQQELAASKQVQKEALEDQRKAQQAQQRVQTIEQTTNLVTAASKIYSQVGNPLIAIPLIALMFGAFTAAKIQAASLAKKEFSEGGIEFIGGGSHASGNDTYLGFQSEGKPAFAERGEAHMITTPKATRKYKYILPALIDSLNKGDFESRFMGERAPTIAINKGSSVNTRKMETELTTIRKQGETKIYQEGGYTVRKRKNITTRIKNA